MREHISADFAGKTPPPFAALLGLLLVSCFLGGSPLLAADLASIKIAAEAGDPAAQKQLGDAFMGVDSKQAEEWYRKAAEQGNGPAQGKLGYLLLMRSKTSFGLSSTARDQLGMEAFNWAAAAADQGDTRGQADLASIYLEGKLTTQDLVQAFKWGDLASRGSSIDVARTTGQSCRDAATLKMTPAQIQQAKALVAQFRPHQNSTELPQPAWTGAIKLQGISGTATKRLAIINGKTFATNDIGTLKLNGRTVQIKCLAITQSTATLSVEGSSKSIDIRLSY